MATGSKKVIYAALAGNTLIAVTKFAAGAITGSAAMFSEGVHSLVDSGNQGLMLHGLRRAQRPPDAEFPFGHGKEVYFWSFVVSILIFAVGAGVSTYEGVLHVIHPEPVANPVVNYAVLALAMVFEGVAWSLALKEFRHLKGRRGYVEAVHEGKDPTIFLVLFEDSAAMLGLVIAAAGLALGHWTGLLWLDGLAAILIGCILGGTALWLAYETKGLLIGESAAGSVVRGIKTLAAAEPGIEHVNEVLTLHMGPDFILATVSVDFRDGVTSADVERAIADLDGRIKAAHPQVKRVFVEAEARRRQGA